MTRRTLRSALCALSLFAALSLSKSSLAATCTLADLKGVAPADTTIVAVSSVAATPTVPAFCGVEGVGSTPGNTVNFRLWLPAPWNGKLLVVGNGGFAG